MFRRQRVNYGSKYRRRAHYNQVVVSLESSSGQWWRNIREIAGLKQGSDNMECLANLLCGGDTQELANQIDAFLQSVLADLIPLTPDVKFTKTDDYNVPDRFIISVADVQEKLAKVNTKKATGPDNIPDWVLQDCALLPAGPVCAIFNSSLRDGCVAVCGSCPSFVSWPRSVHQPFSTSTSGSSP